MAAPEERNRLGTREEGKAERIGGATDTPRSTPPAGPRRPPPAAAGHRPTVVERPEVPVVLPPAARANRGRAVGADAAGAAARVAGAGADSAVPTTRTVWHCTSLDRYREPEPSPLPEASAETAGREAQAADADGTAYSAATSVHRVEAEEGVAAAAREEPWSSTYSV